MNHTTAIRCLLVFITVIGVSCQSRDGRKREEPLARVYDQYLYPSDIEGLFSNSLTKADSQQVARRYINKWITQQLLLRKAELNLSPSELDEIQHQLEETRSSLVIFKYEQLLQKQKIDTVITDEQIEEYYRQMASDFVTDRNIVKALYVKVPKNAPNIEKVRTLYRSSRVEDMNELESYCYQYANKYDFFDEDWIYFDNIKSQLPSEIFNDEQFLRYNTSFEMQDSSFYYFVHVREYRLAGSPAPLSFVRDKIQSIILNKRKIEFIRKLEEDIVKDGIKNNEFEIYEK